MQKILFAALILVSIVSCRRDREEDNGPQPDNQNSAFAARVDSVVYAFNTTNSTYFGSSSFDVTYNQPANWNSAKYSSQIFVPLTFRPSVLIRKGEVHFPDSVPTDSLFASFFEAGTYQYASQAVGGMEVLWIDTNGVLWSTSAMSGDQSGHTFVINNVRTFEDHSGVFCVKFNANFSCTLYNPDFPPILMQDAVYEGIIRKE